MQVKLLKLTLGIIISTACIYYLIENVNSEDLQKTLRELNYFYLLPLFLSIFLAQILIGYRYTLLLQEKDFKSFINISIVGNGANLILPFRGGEFLKIYLSKKRSTLNFFNIFIRVVFERFLDLYFALFIGSLAILILFISGKQNSYFSVTFFISTSCLLVIAILFMVLKQKFDFIVKILRFLFSFLKRKSEKVENSISALRGFHKLLSYKIMAKPFLITAFLWLVLHPISFFFIQKALNIYIDYPSILFVAFFSVLAFIVPSAPSGLGVLHIAITSALVSLGYNLEEGTTYAILFHLGNFFSLGILGIGSWTYLNLLKDHN